MATPGRFYTIKIQPAEGRGDTLDQSIMTQEAVSLEHLLQQLRDPVPPDPDGALNYLAGYDWFRAHHGLIAGQHVSFGIDWVKFNAGSGDGKPSWEVRYLLNGETWTLSLAIHVRRTEPAEVTVQPTEG